jgi:hypothetical protein
LAGNGRPIAIDAAYDGDLFDIDVIDLPERRADLVTGTYRVARPAGSTLPMAVRITDMLGEEVLVIEARYSTTDRARDER